MWQIVWGVAVAALLISGAPAQALDEGAVQVDSLNRKAFASFQTQDFRQAEAAALEAWNRSDPDALGAGLAAANVAAVLAIKGQLDGALQWQGRAEGIFRRKRETGLLGRLAVARAVTHFLGSLKFSAGNAEDSLPDLKEARELLGEEDFRMARVEAQILCNSEQAEHAQAGYMAFVRLSATHEKDGNRMCGARCAVCMGHAEGKSGGHRSALQYYEKALEIYLAEGDSVGAGLALRNIGLARRKLRQYPESEAACRKALDMARGTENTRLEIEALNDLSLLYMEMGDEAGARSADREARAAVQAVAEAIRSGQLDDTVLLDFYQVLKIRYANLLPYSTEMFAGFCDQLALEPPR